MMVFKIVYGGDLCPLAGVILILCCLGRLVADEQKKTWGLGIAIVAFLAFAAFAIVQLPPRDAEAAFVIALRALVAFGLTLGLSWILLPFFAGIARLSWQWTNRFMRTIGLWVGERKRQAADDRRRRQEDEALRMSAPDRERALRTAEAASQSQAQSQKRRDDARAACEMLFHLHAHALGDRLTKAIFDDFVARYMNDQRSPEYVEERGRQLTDLIMQHARRVSSSMDDPSLAAVLAEFQAQVKQIEESTLDEEWKVSLISELQQKFYDRLRSSLDNMA